MANDKSKTASSKSKKEDKDTSNSETKGNGDMAKALGYQQMPKPYSESEFSQNLSAWNTSRMIDLNAKAEFDRNQTLFNTQSMAGQTHRDNLMASHARHVENTVNNPDMQNKLVLFRSGVATDQIWNINEQVQALFDNEAFLKGVNAMMLNMLGDVAKASQSNT